jgi:hypothetical protein
MNLVLNLPFVGRVSSGDTASEIERVDRPPVSWGAIAVVAVAAACWLALGAGVAATLGELGPLLTSIRAG